jgi:hypothetical protein
MIPFDTLLKKLSYDVSPHYCGMDGINKLETAYFFQSALSAGVKGIYVFETSPESLKRFFKPHPVVCVAEAQDETEARLIHRKVWNLSYAPFLIIRLPKQIRVYTGFDYSEKKTDKGLLDKAENIRQLNRILSKLKADAIDSGLIWKSKYAKKLNPDNRVDKHLLKNLKRLGQALSEKSRLKNELIHALIGKFVYLSYLRDRKILTDEWMEKQRIDPESVFSLNATVSGLKNLVDALDERFNGKIFPIDFANEITLKDKHVQWVSAVFSGGDLTDPKNAPDIVIQLHLPFKAYDFGHIPVETLSAIYEQFIFDRKKKGAVYTPEILSDYLISELELYKELNRGMKVLDPACGSGVFLVLVYRRLIEKEMVRLGRKLKPKELLDILQKSIFGVEREQDACYVTEFSLILTLLHYLEPRDLKKLKFHFPILHNRQIFECDFFDIKDEEGKTKFWQRKYDFDWIVGNPPWIELKPKTKGEKFARAWINDKKNKSSYPIGGNRVAEAFSWLVTDILKKDGIAGLILPATSLFNLESRRYRQAFFQKHDVLEITNFANIREKLFDKRSTLPAATLVYRKTAGSDIKPEIRHYAPFAVNQRPVQEGKPWVITINESEIQSISPYEALKGETFLWKTALWATPYDRRIIERINEIFPISLKVLCKKYGWHFRQSAQLRNINENLSDDELEYVQELKGGKKLSTRLMNSSGFRFSVPDSVLEDITDEMCYIRKRGGRAGLMVFRAPHIILSPGWKNYIAYSDDYFVIPPFQLGIFAPKNDSDHLKALSLYLNSNIAAYRLFFLVPEWGVFRQAKRTSITNVREIPVPELTSKQISELAILQNEIVAYEQRKIRDFISEIQKTKFDFDKHPEINSSIESYFQDNLTKNEKRMIDKAVSELRSELQKKVDDNIYRLFKIPEDIRTIVEDFFANRLPLDTPSLINSVIRIPTRLELKEYAFALRDELDNFVMGESFHKVTITYSKELIECAIEITGNNKPIPIDKNSVEKGGLTTAGLLAELGDYLRDQVAQWVYIQRGLRLFDGPRIYIYKTPRLIDWTRTQAIIDAGDIIGEFISSQ